MRWPAGLLLVAALSAAAPAGAQVHAGDSLLGSDLASGVEDHAASGQHFAFELKFGPYRPDVDAEFESGTHPYLDTFGDDDLFYSAFEFDWEFLRIPGGTFSVGVGSGFMQAVGSSLTDEGEPTAEKTVLNVVPVLFPVAFRLDWLANDLHVPLVPYVKGAFAVCYWWVLNGGGTAGTDSDPAWGWTPGFVFSPGIMVQLDFFEPSSARTFDNEVGVNHSYLFFEGTLAWIDDFGGADAMVLSDMTWSAGIAFEF